MQSGHGWFFKATTQRHRIIFWQCLLLAVGPLAVLMHITSGIRGRLSMVWTQGHAVGLNCLRWSTVLDANRDLFHQHQRDLVDITSPITPILCDCLRRLVA